MKFIEFFIAFVLFFIFICGDGKENRGRDAVGKRPQWAERVFLLSHAGTGFRSLPDNCSRTRLSLLYTHTHIYMHNILLYTIIHH